MGIYNVFRKPIEAGLIPGVVALAANDRGVFYEGAFGRRTVDKPEPMTLNSVFRIASMTKAVTGTAAMQLVEEGRMRRQAKPRRAAKRRDPRSLYAEPLLTRLLVRNPTWGRGCAGVWGCGSRLPLNNLIKLPRIDSLSRSTATAAMLT